MNTATPPTVITPCDRILAGNLQSALYLAIQVCREQDWKISPTFCSAFRAGLESNLAAMRAGMDLTIC